MNEYIDILKDCAFFTGISDIDLDKMYYCLSPVMKSYKKGDIIIFAGETVKEIGIVASGELVATKDTATGDSVLLGTIEKGEVVGEILAGCDSPKSPVTISAYQNSKVLFFPYSRVANICPKGCVCHNEMLKNVIQLISRKYIVLHERIACLALKSVREKIIMFLSEEKNQTGEKTFLIKYNREQLATYLNIERSALSRELSRMKQENLIDYYKNTFKILF